MSAPHNHVPTLRLKSPAELLRKDRLPSFRTRDLTLGGLAGVNIKTEPRDSAATVAAAAAAANANKKVFKPNLNVTRSKNTDVRTSRDSSANSRTRGGVRADRGGKNDRGGKRGSTIIQTQGVFSEGASAATLKRQSAGYRSYGSRDSSASVAEFLQRPTFKKADIKVDVEDERRQINEILADEDEDKSTESDKIMPICLKSYAKVKQEVNEIATKVEHMNTNDIIGEGLGDFIEGQNDSLFLMQFPDTLPGLAPEPKIMKIDSKEGILDDTNNGSNASLNTSSGSENFCTFRNLPEGQVGELIRYRSGRMVLVLGDNQRFDVTHGADSTFLQEVVSISTNSAERSGTIVNLGPVQGRLVVSPDWPQLLNS